MAPPPPPLPPEDARAAPPLPHHLQNAVHRALSDLQAQSLLYPQQCAAAEAQGETAREEAERRVLSALGGAFDYPAAKAELEQARRAAKALSRQQRRGGGRAAGVGAESGAESPAQPAPVHPAPPAANSGEDDLWGSFEAFSAAVAAEVDQRIAAARLRPPLGPSSEYPRRQQPQGQEPAQPCREPAPEAASQEQPSRRPLGSLQQVSVPAGQARKRGRSSHDAPPLAAAEAQDGRPAGQRRAAAAPLPVPAPPAGSPACKRQRPHVAFGTRCDAPRTTRSLKPVRLDAAQAPTPPQLPSAAPAVADRQGAKGPAAGSAAAAASGVPRPDLLRSLGTALAGRDGIPSGKTAGEQASRGAGTAAPAVLLNSMGGAGQLQQLLGDLTAALHGLQPSSVAEAALSGDAHGSSVHAVLQQQGITAVEAQDASSLLQIVLDRMDAIAARPASPPAVAPPVAASEQLLPAAAAAAASDGGPPPSASCVPASLPGPAAPDTAQTDALCCRLSHLLDSSGAQLQDVGAGLAAALHAEARLQRIGAAAMEAALAGAESAVACMAREPAAAPAAAMAQPQAEPRPSTFAGRPAEQPASPPLAGSLSLAPGEPPACSVIVAPHRAQPAAAHEGEMHHKHVEQQPARQPTTAAEPTEDANQPVPAQLLPSTDMPAAVRSAPIGCPAPTQPSMVCAAIGIPLELPSQPQWLLPWGGSSGLMLQPQSAVVPGFPAYGALHQDQQQAQQEGQGDASFSVASDEELEDEPPKETSSASASEASASPACTGMVPPVDLAASKEQDGGGQQGQEQQALLDDMAALAIAQYRQINHAVEEHEAEQADHGAWDVAMRAMGRSAVPRPGEMVETGDGNGEAAGCSSAEAAPACETTHAAAAAPSNTSSPEAAVQPEASEQGVALPMPAALGVPRPAPPYNPIKAAAEAAAAARRERDAAGWRRLRERADMLALWHEYAAELGISGGCESEEAQQQELVAPDPAAEQLPTAAQLHQAAAAPAALVPAPDSGEAAPAVPQQRRHPGQGQWLWRAADPAQAETEPAAHATPPPPPSAGLSQTATPTTSGSSSTCPSSEDSGSLLTDSSCTGTDASIRLAGRHKARALRYRLLRHQLAAAAGLRQSMATDGGYGGSECSGLSPLSAAQIAPADSSYAKPATAAGQLQPPAQLPGTVLGVPVDNVSSRAVAPPPPSLSCDQQQAEQQLAATPPAVSHAVGASEAGAAGMPCALPAAAAAAAGQAGGRVHPRGLADHLSDATPSVASAPASACWQRSGGSGSWGEAQGPCPARQRDWRLRPMSCSSCSTLGEIGGCSSPAGGLAFKHDRGEGSWLGASNAASAVNPTNSTDDFIAATLARCAAHQAAALASARAPGSIAAEAAPASEPEAPPSAAGADCDRLIHISSLRAAVSAPAGPDCRVTVSSSRGLAALRALKERVAAGRQRR